MIRNIKNLLPIIAFFLLTGAAFKYGGIKHDITSTAKTGAITTLTASSSQVESFTGTSGQTVKLPSGLTLSNGYWYTVINEGTTGSVVVQDASASVLATLTASQSSTFYMNNSSVIGGNWSVDPGAGSGAGGATGGASVQCVVKSATYSVVTTDTCLIGNSDVVVTFNLPAATSVMAPLYIGRDSTHDVVISGNGSDTINGSPTFTLPAASTSVILNNNQGSKWYLF